MTKLRAGKLEAGLLERLLHRHATAVTQRLVIPPRVGEDAAVIDLPDRYLVVGTDPITFVTEDLGHYVVTINANDVATMGARPLFFSCVLLLPDDAVESRDLEQIFHQIQNACEEHQVSWIGGHTEITPAVSAPVAVGQMVGEVAKDALVRKESLRPGDRLLLTKSLAVEAVSIIARARPVAVSEAHGDAFLARAQAFLREPGIGVVNEALAACRTGKVRAMHDPTEGGLAGGLQELSAAASLGLRIDREAIPISPETALLCEQFDLDPLGVIASGSLLIGAAADEADAVIRAVQELGVECGCIGEVEASPVGCRFEDGSPLPSFAVDEITKLFR
jgi:hydrogenase maturation factor